MYFEKYESHPKEHYTKKSLEVSGIKCTSGFKSYFLALLCIYGIPIVPSTTIKYIPVDPWPCLPGGACTPANHTFHFPPSSPTYPPPIPLLAPDSVLLSDTTRYVTTACGKDFQKAQKATGPNGVSPAVLEYGRLAPVFSGIYGSNDGSHTPQDWEEAIVVPVP